MIAVLDKESLSHKIVCFLERGSGWFLLLMVTLTVLLVVPIATMAPDEDASDNPGLERPGTLSREFAI